MTILILLSILCICRHCRGGISDQLRERVLGSRTGVLNHSGEPSIQDLPLQQGDIPKIAPPGPATPSAMGPMNFSSENAEPSGPNVGIAITLDIASPDPSICSSYEYDYDDNAMRLILPREGHSIAKLMNGTEEVWKAQIGEKLEHAKAYLNGDGRAELVLVAKRDSYGLHFAWYTVVRNVWNETRDHEKKMETLKVYPECTSDSSLDLSTDKDDATCKIFQVKLLGVDTRFFIPKNGYHAMEVKDGSTILWTSSGGTEHCLSCELYLDATGPILAILNTRNNGVSTLYKCKEGNTWKDCKESDFKKRFGEAQSRSNFP